MKPEQRQTEATVTRLPTATIDSLYLLHIEIGGSIGKIDIDLRDFGGRGHKKKSIPLYQGLQKAHSSLVTVKRNIHRLYMLSAGDLWVCPKIWLLAVQKTIQRGKLIAETAKKSLHLSYHQDKESFLLELVELAKHSSPDISDSDLLCAIAPYARQFPTPDKIDNLAIQISSFIPLSSIRSQVSQSLKLTAEAATHLEAEIPRQLCHDFYSHICTALSAVAAETNATAINLAGELLEGIEGWQVGRRITRISKAANFLQTRITTLRCLHETPLLCQLAELNESLLAILSKATEAKLAPDEHLNLEAEFCSLVESFRAVHNGSGKNQSDAQSLKSWKGLDRSGFAQREAS